MSTEIQRAAFDRCQNAAIEIANAKDFYNQAIGTAVKVSDLTAAQETVYRQAVDRLDAAEAARDVADAALEAAEAET